MDVPLTTAQKTVPFHAIAAAYCGIVTFAQMQPNDIFLIVMEVADAATVMTVGLEFPGIR